MALGVFFGLTKPSLELGACVRRDMLSKTSVPVSRLTLGWSSKDSLYDKNCGLWLIKTTGTFALKVEEQGVDDAKIDFTKQPADYVRPPSLVPCLLFSCLLLTALNS